MDANGPQGDGWTRKGIILFYTLMPLLVMLPFFCLVTVLVITVMGESWSSYEKWLPHYYHNRYMANVLLAAPTEPGATLYCWGMVPGTSEISNDRHGVGSLW